MKRLILYRVCAKFGNHAALLLAICAGSCVLSHARPNFRPGSVRQRDGQTQQGFIGTLKPGIPDGIEFKATEAGDVRLYYANEIEGFTVDNSTYTSYNNSASKKTGMNGLFFVRKKDSNELIHLSSKYKSALRSIGTFAVCESRT